jgi:beta-N-acetylhexosaminidase
VVRSRGPTLGVAAALALTGWALALVGWGCGSSGPHRPTSATKVGRLAGHAVLTGRSPGDQSSSSTPPPAAVSLAARLPLARQVAQLFLVGLDGKSSTAVTALGNQDWGGVVFDSSNFVSDSQVSTLAAAITAQAGAAHGTAPLLAATQEGGLQTAFGDVPPMAEPAISATGLPSVARSQAILAGKRLRTLGFNMTLAPLADVDTAGGPLSGRLFSADPATVAQFSAAAIGGYTAAGTISAVGHFPGTGGASADPDQQTATVGGSLAQLRARDLIPFAAVAPLAPVVMMSNATYVAFDGVTPAGLLGRAVALLRSGYAFGGVVMSDDLDATLQPTGEGPGAVAVQALEAGDDLLYISGPPSERAAAYGAVLAAAQGSAAVQARVHEALLRVLSLKVRYRIVR